MNEIKLRPRLSWRRARRALEAYALAVAFWLVVGVLPMGMGYWLGSGDLGFWTENAVRCWEQK